MQTAQIAGADAAGRSQVALALPGQARADAARAGREEARAASARALREPGERRARLPCQDVRRAFGKTRFLFCFPSRKLRCEH